ncbi:MAG: sigma-70 family RNA polymerase sigma factor [Planctomycetes bacterium]|nr:sigma-70 family RNA polymerase sigma factor [Planctomycetota bacterium]
MPQDDRETPQLTLLLQQIGESAPARCSAAFAGIYEELRRIARQHLGQERIGHTLQATALVHEAWLRLFGTRRAFASGQEFLAAAANSMRRVLVDHARGKGRQKRRAAGRAVPLDAVALATADDPDHVLAVDEALTALEQQDPRLGEQARLRLFAGLDEAEVAATLGVSDRTVRRDWMFIRAFLQRQLDAEA